MSVVILLNAGDFEEATRYDSVIFDARKAGKFISGFVPGSVYLFYDFWKVKYFVKAVTEFKEDFYLVSSAKKIEEKAEWLQNESGKKVEAALDGGYEAWEAAGKNIDMVISIEPDEIMMDMKYGAPKIIDVRNKAAYELMHVEGAEHVDAEQLLKKVKNVKDEETYYLYCEDGEFSLSLISLLKRSGFHNFYHLQGGFKSLNQAEASMAKK